MISAGTRPAGARVVVVVPVFNEHDTVERVLDEIWDVAAAAEIVVVDDGSTDGSSMLIDDWAAERSRVAVLRHASNRGYSEALRSGFRHAIQKLDSGSLSPDDIVATIDADGQHDPAALPAFLDTMSREGLDVLWARRDFTLYPRWKRWGNALMAIIGSALAGVSFKDVESGYCLFRIAPLKHALSLGARDHRYSVSMTLAVLLGRLGYRISNEPVARIPLYRSRTRLADVFVDTWAGLSAWWAVMARKPGTLVKCGVGAVVLVATLAATVAVGTKRIYLGLDSINNYAHTWYIAERLYHGSLSFRLPYLEGGRALTYPYGFIPWTLAAVARPLAGDYAVTWLMVLAFVLVLAVVFSTRLGRSPWLLSLYLLVPFVPGVLLNFQMSFAWGLLFGFLHARAVDRRQMLWAMVWLFAALGTHLLVMGPILALYAAWQWLSSREIRSALGLMWLAATPLVGIIAWYTSRTPSVGEADLATVALVVTLTIGARAAVFFAPFALRWLSEHPRQVLRHATGTAGAFALIAITVPWNIRFSSRDGLGSGTELDYSKYLARPEFMPGATYRLTEAPGHEIGQYEFIKHGGILDGEFFDESRFRRNWTVASYTCFLGAKGVDFVLVTAQYERVTRTNEPELLRGFVSDGTAQVQYTDPNSGFRVYDVRPLNVGSERRGVRECLSF